MGDLIENIKVMVSKDQRALVERAAKADDRTLSAWVRKVMIDAAQKVVGKTK